MPERWLPIPDFPGYEVSDHGRVRTYKNATGKGPYMLAIRVSYFGRQRILLKQGEQRRMCYIHRLVLEAFRGPCPPEHETHHLDSDPTNNHLSNLVYLTHADHMARHGGSTFEGSSHLAQETVLEIRNLRQQGWSLKRLADRFNRTIPTISNISRGLSYPGMGGPLTFGDVSLDRPGEYITATIGE